MNSFKYSFKNDEEENILVKVYNCGYQKCESGYSMGPVVRDRYLIHHVFSGKGYYIVNHKTYKLQEGDSFIIYPNTVVNYYADVNDPWEYYWVGFRGAEIKSLISQTDFTPENVVISTHHNQELKEILLKLYHASGEALHNQIAMVGYLYLFLSILIQDSEHRQTGIDISMEYIRQAIDYVSENYEKHITVTDIADALGVSRSHLYRVFVKNMALSPKVYLENYRIQQSCVLLQETSMTINEIASSVGYEDQLHFSKVFKKQMNLSPKDYRKRYSQKTTI